MAIPEQMCVHLFGIMVDEHGYWTHEVRLGEKRPPREKVMFDFDFCPECGAKLDWKS